GFNTLLTSQMSMKSRAAPTKAQSTHASTAELTSALNSKSYRSSIRGGQVLPTCSTGVLMCSVALPRIRKCALGNIVCPMSTAASARQSSVGHM
ncbi:MAG: hypothetical protein ACK55Z_25175, partial [bacterium]